MKKRALLVIIGIGFIGVFYTCKPPASAPMEITTTVDYESLSLELDSLYDADQKYRIRLTEMIRNKEPFDNEFVKEMNDSDSLIKTRMIEILDEHGWLPKEKVGDKAFNAMFLAIQHADVETMEKYYPGFQAIADTDPTIRTSAALMQDRILMYRSKKQVYGSQSSGRNTESGDYEYYIWPIENPESVNDRRKAVGFDQTIEAYAKDLDAVYNPAEVIVEFGNNQL